MEWKQALETSQSSGSSSLETFLGGMETGAGSGLRNGAPALKPSLVEWKQDLAPVRILMPNALKPSLVEWKPSSTVPLGFILFPLKPSLVEWKQTIAKAFASLPKALKPSLVEWKRQSLLAGSYMVLALETFLGGMETGLRNRPYCGACPIP